MNALGELNRIKITSVTTGGPEVFFELPQPTLTAPSRKEGTVEKETNSGLNLSFITDNLLNIKPRIPNKYRDDELYKYIQKVLNCFIEPKIINYILNAKSMSIWKKCFTHISSNPNDGENYETLESVGDKILSYTFKTFLYQKYPKITARQLNNLDQFYMSTHLQSLISEKMGLTNWLVVEGDIPRSSEKIREDLLESLFGTIDTILIKQMGFGFGSRCCMKFYTGII